MLERGTFVEDINCELFSFACSCTGDATAPDIDKAMKLGAGTLYEDSVIVALTGLPTGYSVIVALYRIQCNNSSNRSP